MTLAWKEMLRRRGRFVSVGTALLLVNVLVLFLVSQLTGLLEGGTGAIRSLDADLVTVQADVERSLFRSTIPAADESAADAVPGVDAAGLVGISFGTGRLTAETVPDELFDLAVFGFQPGEPGTPADVSEGRLPRPGESGVGAIDATAKNDGVELGDSVWFAEYPEPFEVVGFVSGSTFQLQPTMWVDIASWQEIQAAVSPERGGAGPSGNILAVSLEPGADPAEVTAALDETLGDTETLTVDTLIDSLPGVSEQSQTFYTIIAMTYLAAAIVVTLFFALITLEKTEQIGILKAIGAKTRTLAGSVVVQGLLLAIPAFLGAVAVMLVVAALLPANLPFAVSLRPWALTGMLTLFVSVAGALLSYRRIARLDPANAIGGGDG